MVIKENLRFNIKPLAEILGITLKTLYSGYKLDYRKKVMLTPERQKIKAVKEILTRKEAEAHKEIEVYLQNN